MRPKKIVVIIRKRHLKPFFLIAIMILTLIILFAFSSFGNDSVGLTSAGIHTPKLAIIIDDFGQNQNGVEEMMTIRRHLTFAVMPFLDYSEQNAADAHKRGYEVILHLPMQSETSDIPNWLGPMPVRVTLEDEEIKKIVKDSIDSVPFAVGVNIHMGVLASEDERVMTDVLKAVKEKKLYFVDSVTTPKTVCSSVAGRVGVTFAERDVFLEHSSKSKADIKKQLLLAGDIALDHGYAIAIGHVGSEGGEVTAKAIRETIPELERKGIKLVFVSELFK